MLYYGNAKYWLPELIRTTEHSGTGKWEARYIISMPLPLWFAVLSLQGLSMHGKVSGLCQGRAVMSWW